MLRCNNSRESFLVTFGLLLTVCAALFGGFHLISVNAPTIFPSTTLTLVLGVSTLFTGVVLGFRKKQLPQLSLEAVALSVFLVSLSDIPIRKFTFFAGTPFVAYWLGSFLLTWLLLRYIPHVAWKIVLALCVLSGGYTFLHHLHFSLIFSDDHPSFLYRLIQLKHEFPFIPFYNPQWNGGVEAREFFPSGVLAPFFLFWPLWRFFSIAEVYSLAVGLLLFAVFPLSCYCAARVLQTEKRAAPLAAILSFSFSLLWYRWALSYGTLGFVTSTSLLPLVASLLIDLHRKGTAISSWRLTALVIFGTLCALWSLNVIAILPLLLALLVRLPRFIRSKRVMFAIGSALALNLPWMTVFVMSSRVDKVISAAAPADRAEKTAGIEQPVRFRSAETASPADTTGRNIREFAASINPVVALCAAPGLLLLPLGARALFGILLAWLVFLGGPLAWVAPQLELSRMLLTASLLAIFPAAVLLSRAIQESSNFGVPATVLFSWITLSPAALWRTTADKTSEKYHRASQTVAHVSDAIRKFSSGGRTLFAGFTLHELSSGHVAPLPELSGVPLVAMSYQHDRWQYLDVIPLYYRERGVEGVEEFFDTMNVTEIVAHDRFWNSWLKKRSGRYERLWDSERFSLFRRKAYKSNYFLAGQGAIVSQDPSSVRFKLDSPSAILKFNYLPFLKISGCDVASHPLEGGVRLVAVNNCVDGGVHTLSAISPLGRLRAVTGVSKVKP